MKKLVIAAVQSKTSDELPPGYKLMCNSEGKYKWVWPDGYPGANIYDNREVAIRKAWDMYEVRKEAGISLNKQKEHEKQYPFLKCD